jgi:hypothetical protein
MASETRQDRAQALFESGARPIKIASHAWDVEGSNGRLYQVEELPDGAYNCTCPDQLYRGHSGETCKHIDLVLMTEGFDARAAEDKICETCAEAVNKSAPYLFCPRDRAHYSHKRPGCGHWKG